MDSTEPWYGTTYSVEKLTSSTIEHLRAPNVFIPTCLSLKNVSEQMTLPQLLSKSPHSRLWYMPNTAFSTPKAYVKTEFNCLFTGSSPESEAFTEIFMRLLMDYFNEYGKSESDGKTMLYD
ncbi:Zinc-metallopeptidase [Abeliophyllum distichum]|uniref:Zinc-metallopeptidase n=1 Tax=Abeliophyllum distichum TaxID=126358 RepID=A0ABD1NXT7_9LAMI